MALTSHFALRPHSVSEVRLCKSLRSDDVPAATKGPALVHWRQHLDLTRLRLRPTRHVASSQASWDADPWAAFQAAEPRVDSRQSRVKSFRAALQECTFRSASGYNLLTQPPRDVILHQSTVAANTRALTCASSLSRASIREADLRRSPPPRSRWTSPVNGALNHLRPPSLHGGKGVSYALFSKLDSNAPTFADQGF